MNKDWRLFQRPKGILCLCVVFNFLRTLLWKILTKSLLSLYPITRFRSFASFEVFFVLFVPNNLRKFHKFFSYLLTISFKVQNGKVPKGTLVHFSIIFSNLSKKTALKGLDKESQVCTQLHGSFVVFFWYLEKNN